MAARILRRPFVALAAALLSVAIGSPVLASASLPTPPSAVANVKVPLPRLRPKPSGALAPSVRPGTTGTAPATTPVALPVVPATPGFQVNPRSRFTAEQQLDLARITAYFNSFHTMEGKFVQIAPSGEQTEGSFNLSRPGNIRFHYNPPSKLDVVADGRSVAIRDGASRTQDIYPLTRTPLRYLLAEQVDLTSDSLVDSIHEEPDLISVLIIERSVFAQGKLVLIFDRRTYVLRQWIVTDAQGLNTSIAIYNVSTDKPQNPNQFVITSTF
jgi:outer membrane lipoprotein-sorting protein